MRIRVELLTDSLFDSYEHWLSTVPDALIFHSVPYLRMLRRIVAAGSDQYLLAFESNRIVGALPVFLKSGAQGNVLNSLPFFGSNGGLLLDPDFSAAENARQVLIDAWHSLGREQDVVAATLVSNPLSEMDVFYRTTLRHSLCDSRVGQITPLPVYDGNDDRCGDQLMSSYHVKTRNSVRKGQKSGIIVEHCASAEAMRVLASMHAENMQSIGGTAKPLSVFETIREEFVYDRHYRVYRAIKGEDVIASLLVFFHNQTAEYFTPATVAEARILQPMSLLIFEAMREAARRGCDHWNWGGTWLSQGGVYQFKSRWGTKDIPYFYYVDVVDESVLDCERETLLREYPYFYVVPFDRLRTSSPMAVA